MLETEEQELAQKFVELHAKFCEENNCFVEPIFQMIAVPARAIQVVGVAYQATSKKRLTKPSNIIVPGGGRPN